MTLSRATAWLTALLLVLPLSVFSGCASNDEPPMEGPSTEVEPQEQDFDAARASRTAASARYVAKGRALADAGKHAEAKEAFQQAIAEDPTNADAQSGYSSMIGILKGSGAQDQDPFARSLAQEEERRVKARMHYEKGLEERARGRLGESVVELQKAYQLVKFGATPLADLPVEVVKATLDETQELKDRADRESDMQKRAEIARIQQAEEERERKRLERRLRALWDNALNRFSSEQFERCERICDEIVRLNFRDVNAVKLKEASRKARQARARETNISNYREEWQRIFQDVKEAMIPTDEIQFPSVDAWKKISNRGPLELNKSGVAEESEADREVRQRLASTILPKVDWNGKTLSDIVEELRAQANVNIFVTPEGRDAADDAGELGLEFTQVTADHALDAACSGLGVTYSISDGIVKIQTPEESRRNKVVEFYDVRDLVSPINSFPGVSLNLNASGVGLDEDEFDDEEGEPNQAIEADRLVELIKRAVDPNWDEDEGNKLEPKQGTLIVRQTPEKQRLVRDLLADLRQNTGIQVRIEARFITVTNNFLQEIGVDVRGLGDDSGGVGNAGPGTNTPFDDFGVTGTGFGTPSNPLGVGSGNDAGLFFTENHGNTDLRARSENLFDEILGNQAIDNSGGLSFQFAWLDDTQLEAILRAVQKYERINTVTAPSLVVYNTQRSNLTILNEISYVKDFDVEIAQAAVIADPVIDKVREGVVLDVRPIVSNDRRFVTMELRPTVATLIRPIRNFTTQLGVGAAVTIQLPELHKEQINTTVVVPDGGTLLLGGLKFAEEKTLESGVPILSDIPIVSFFFSKTGKFTNLMDLIVLLKVKILILPELEPGELEGGF